MLNKYNFLISTVSDVLVCKLQGMCYDKKHMACPVSNFYARCCSSSGFEMQCSRFSDTRHGLNLNNKNKNCDLLFLVETAFVLFFRLKKTESTVLTTKWYVLLFSAVPAEFHDNIQNSGENLSLCFYLIHQNSTPSNTRHCRQIISRTRPFLLIFISDFNVPSAEEQ